MNKPVAWMIEADIDWIDDDNENPSEFAFLKSKPKEKGWIPLYTHPVKELTDEEIIAEAVKFGVIIADTGLKAIKAILRKAQEK